jgi:hypothetical protein
MDQQVTTAKKVQLEVHSAQADALREKGQDFMAALQGKMVKPNDSVVFGQMILDVKSTKPKGPVLIGKRTAVKMSISSKPMVLSCPGCGHVHDSPVESCTQCGAQMSMVML